MANMISNPEPQPVQGDRGAPILGPRNIFFEGENPDLLASPYNDGSH